MNMLLLLLLVVAIILCVMTMIDHVLRSWTFSQNAKKSLDSATGDPAHKTFALELATLIGARAVGICHDSKYSYAWKSPAKIDSKAMSRYAFQLPETSVMVSAYVVREERKDTVHVYMTSSDRLDFLCSSSLSDIIMIADMINKQVSARTC